MKEYLVAIFMLFYLAVHCQDDKVEYLIQREDTVELSGFISFHSGVSSMYGRATYVNGGRIAALFSQKYFIGFFNANSIANPAINYDKNGEDISVLVKQKNNGIWLGYISDYKKKLHWSSSLQFGFGSVFMIDEDYDDLIDYDDSYTSAPYFNKSRFLSLRPQLEYEMNVFKWMKINTGLGYHYTILFDDKYTSSDLSSPFINLKFMFGIFHKSYPVNLDEND